MKLWRNDEYLNYHLGFMKNVMWWWWGNKKKSTGGSSGGYKPDTSYSDAWKTSTGGHFKDYGDIGYGKSAPGYSGGTYRGTNYAPSYPSYPGTSSVVTQPLSTIGGGGGMKYSFPEIKSPNIASFSYPNFSSAITQPLSTMRGGSPTYTQQIRDTYKPTQLSTPDLGSLGQRLAGTRGMTKAYGIPETPGAYGTITPIGEGEVVKSPMAFEPRAASSQAEETQQQDPGLWGQLMGGLTDALGDKPIAIGLRLGSAAVPTAEPSYEARERYGDVYGKIMGEGGATPLGQVGTEKLGEMLQREPEIASTPVGQIGAVKLGEMAEGQGWTELDQNRYDVAASQIDENLQVRLDQLQKYYAKFNALDSGEYREAVADLMKETDREKNKMLYEMQAKGMDRQYKAVVDALNYEISSRQQELSEADRAMTYDVQTVSQLFGLAREIGADEILRTNIQNQDYEALRQDLNTLAYAFDGGGAVREKGGKYYDERGRQISPEMVQLIQSKQ